MFSYDKSTNLYRCFSFLSNGRKKIKSGKICYSLALHEVSIMAKIAITQETTTVKMETEKRNRIKNYLINS